MRLTNMRLLKEADIGGSSETSFEQSFSNLAHSSLKEKAPKLMQYEVGFQLLSKDDDDTKAVGVFGFKVGSQWLYAPVFFLNGRMAGNELLYVKNQDSFLPLTDDWIDYILGRKPSILGDGVNRNLSLLGVMPPNLYQLSRSPQKFASSSDEPACCTPDNQAQGALTEKVTHTEPNNPTATTKLVEKRTRITPKMASWFRDFLPKLSYLAYTPLDQEPKYKDMKGMPDLLKEAGEPLFRYLIEKIGSEYPGIIETIDNMYGPEFLTDMAQKIAADKVRETSNSITKDAALHVSGDKKPADWNGHLTDPSKQNGGIATYGKEAWDNAREGRSYINRHGGAQIGKYDDLAIKAGMSSCYGPSKPNKPIKPKRLKGRVKRGSITPSLIGPMEAQPKGKKHRAISKDTVKKNPDVVHDLTADEREMLLKERIVYKDDRDDKEVTIAYDTQGPLRLQNPDHTGIYQVLTKPDKFEKCLIIMGPYSTCQRKSFCTVVRLDGKKTYVNAYPINIFTTSEYDLDLWKKWLKEQKDADSIPLSSSGRKCYVLLGPTGQGTVPLRAHEEYANDADKDKVYDVCTEDHCWDDRPAYLPDHSPRHDFYSGGFHATGDRVILTGQPGIKIRLNRNDIMIPLGFKLITVQDEDNPEETKSEPLMLGNLIDVQMALYRNTQPMRIVSDGKDVTVQENRMDKDAACICLFEEYGLRKEAAEALVERALREKKVECLLKFALGSDSNDMIRGAPNAPPFPEPNVGYDPMSGGNIPTMQMSENVVPVPDMSSSKTDRSIYYPMGPDPKSMQVAQDAARTGQKEIFDTAALGNLLKIVNQDDMVSRYLGDLMKGLDRLGRILFVMYWHGESFSEQFGSEDLETLEDALRNSFSGLGEVVLSLKKRSPQQDPDNGGNNTDLEAVAENQS